MGSGTTAIVAEALGRKWFGIERDKKYKNIQNSLINKILIDFCIIDFMYPS